MDNFLVESHWDDNSQTDDLRGGSQQDFWIFFSFAMVFLVVVMMNYVTYLSSLVVTIRDTESKDSAQKNALSIESETNHLEIRLRRNLDTILYSFDQSMEEISKELMIKHVQNRIQNLDGPADIYIHAPGDVLYQDVFDVSYWASQGKYENNIHLVFIEE